MRRTLGIVLAALAAVASLVWFFGIRGTRPVPPDDRPADEPFERPRTAPVPVPEAAGQGFPVASTVEEPVVAGSSACADLGAVYERMKQQGLDEADRACLAERVQLDDDTENVLRLLVIEAWNRDEAAWERRALQLASITEDPDLHYKLAIHFSDRDQAEAALHHAEVAMQESHAWPPGVVGARTRRLDQLRTTLCEATPQAEPCTR